MSKEGMVTLSTSYLTTIQDHRNDISQNRLDISQNRQDTSSNLSKITDISNNRIKDIEDDITDISNNRITAIEQDITDVSNNWIAAIEQDIADLSDNRIKDIEDAAEIANAITAAISAAQPLYETGKWVSGKLKKSQIVW